MKVKPTLACLGAALALSAPAGGDYEGLIAEQYLGAGWIENGFSGLTAWRIYAVFNEPTDGLVAVFGAPDHPMSVVSTAGFFHNDALYDSLTAPVDYTGPPFNYWANQWDTFVTIGTDNAAGDATGLTPGFADEVGNLAGDFTTSNASWYVMPGDPQALAGSKCVVLLGQFVVPEGDSIAVLLSLQMLGGWVQYDQYLPLLPPCPADITGDDMVDVMDLLELLAAWGPCSCCPADINHDATVDVADLLMLLAAWGPCANDDDAR